MSCCETKSKLGFLRSVNQYGVKIKKQNKNEKELYNNNYYFWRLVCLNSDFYIFFIFFDNKIFEQIKDSNA